MHARRQPVESHHLVHEIFYWKDTQRQKGQWRKKEMKKTKLTGVIPGLELTSKYPGFTKKLVFRLGVALCFGISKQLKQQNLEGFSITIVFFRCEMDKCFPCKTSICLRWGCTYLSYVACSFLELARCTDRLFIAAIQLNYPSYACS